MRYIESADRSQLTLVHECIDDYIPENSEVRIFDSFVNKLDLSKLNFTRSNKLPSTQGAPKYKAKDLLKLYIYGHQHKIRSSRKLEWLTKTNLEMKWLLGNLSPDHKTISDFRKENGKGLKKVLRLFVLFLSENDLIDGKLVACDGSKLRANTSSDRIYSLKKLETAINTIEQDIEKYLNQIAYNDKIEKKQKLANLTDEQLEVKLNKLEEKLAKYEKIKEELKREDKKQISLCDKDSAIMKSREGKKPCYNQQIVVDSKNKFIVCEDVCQEPVDNNLLNKMIDQTKEVLSEAEKIVFDNGYYEMNQIAEGTQKIDLYVALNSITKTKSEGFTYDSERDIYICPDQKEMKYIGKVKQNNKILKKYYCKHCKGCQLRKDCTSSQRGRIIKRYIKEEIIETHRQKVKSQQGVDIIKKRKAIVEHIFGSEKLWLGKTPFLLRGLEKVKIESSLFGISYNFRRLLNLIPFNRILDMISQWKPKYENEIA